MELEDAIKYVEVFLEYEKWYAHSGNDEDFLRGIDKTAIEKILEQLKKQEKMIDIIIKHICDIIDNDDNASLLPFYDSDDNIEEKVKQYFEKKAKESNNK